MIHCHALDDSPLRPKGLDVFDNPRQRFNSKEVTICYSLNDMNRTCIPVLIYLKMQLNLLLTQSMPINPILL